MKRCQEVVPLLGPHIDGALPDDDLAWVDDHLRGCASCTDRKALFVAQGDALREVLSARGAAADFTGFAGRVLARVGNDRAGPPLRAYGSELWGAHKRAFAAAGGLALAGCMALAVLFFPQRIQSADDAALLAEAGSEIQVVDFGTHDGAVLQLPHDTTVIWMSDDRGVQQ
jgi:anti-sigma factor RsiW